MQIPSVSRCLAALTLALGSTLALSCEDHNASEVVLIFSGDVSTGDGQGVPPEVGFIEISGSRAGNDIFAQFDVGRSGGLTALPASLVLYNSTGSDPATVGSLTLRAYKSGVDGDPLISHTFSFNLVDKETRLLRVPLQLSCYRTTCLGGQTCIDGECVGPVFVDAKSLPTYAPELDPTKNTQNCLDIRSTACFSGARQVSATAVLINEADTQRCLLRVPSSEVPSGREDRLNLAAVWNESGGRYAILDRIPDKDPATPWRKTEGGWTFNRVVGNDAYFEFNLPKGVCEHTPIGKTGRIQSFVFASSDQACPTKTPQIDVCDHLPLEATVGSSSCLAPVLPENFISPACSKCVTANVPLAFSSCQKDAACEQVLSCVVSCRALNPGDDCVTRCARADGCISQDALKLVAGVAPKISEAVDQCTKEEKCVVLKKN